MHVASGELAKNCGVSFDRKCERDKWRGGGEAYVEIGEEESTWLLFAIAHERKSSFR